MGMNGMKSRWKFIDGDMLKWIAIVTMLVDHIGAALLEAVILQGGGTYRLYEIDGVLRSIGRTAFPIFAFLLVEGFFYTHDRKKYLGRLLLFTVLSEVPFDLAFYGQICYRDAQNVFWTLAIGFLVIGSLEFLYGKYEQRREYIARGRKYLRGEDADGGGAFSWMTLFYTGFLFCFGVLFILAGVFAAICFRTDYNGYGVLLIVLFYLGKRLGVWPALTCLGGYLLFLWEPWCLGGFLLILCYNGARKRRGKGFQYFFYLFYPAHLLIFGFIRVVFLAN